MTTEIEVEKKIDFCIEVTLRCSTCAKELEFTHDVNTYGDMEFSIDKCDCTE